MIATLPVPATDHCGDIVCRCVRGRSVLTRMRSQAPLKLFAPRGAGDIARVVASSFGGGLVAGDRVPVRVNVEAGARCLLTTQSSTKVYRSDDDACVQTLDAVVGDHALLAVLPDPVSCFAGARYEQRQRFDLSEQGNLVWLDWITSGRWARDERWAFTSLQSRTDVRVEGDLVLRETLRLSDVDGDVGGPLRMGRFDCYAVLVMVGPALADAAGVAEAMIEQWPAEPRERFLASSARIRNGLVVRLMGPRAQAVQDRLRILLSPLHELLGGDPWSRKW